MKKQTSQVNEILNYQDRTFSIREQKAELLLRNAAFQADLKQLRLHFVYQNRADEIIEALHKKKIREYTEAEARLGIRDFVSAAAWFFEKWEIRTLWRGQRETLHNYITAGPVLRGYGKLPPSVSRCQKTLVLSGPMFFITIDPWTTKKRVAKLCDLLPKIRETYFGFTIESKREFARDLAWYDLKSRCNLTPTKIAKVWVERRPNEFKKLLKKTRAWKGKRPPDLDKIYLEFNLPQTIRAAIDRLQAGINYLTR